jgi:beta-1,4-N-acetylglucosaminyltransferase
MILVTVGASNIPFDRLVSAMDMLAAELDERVIIQYGNSTYKLLHAEGFAWTTRPEMEQLSSEARVIVAHSGAGTIITGLKYLKPMIIVPRLPELNEHIDHHQLQLAKALTAAGKVISIENPDLDKLHEALEQVDKIKPSTNKPYQLIQAIKEILSEWENK